MRSLIVANENFTIWLEHNDPVRGEPINNKNIY